MKSNISKKKFISAIVGVIILTESRPLLAHDKRLHIRNKPSKAKIEDKSTEDIPQEVIPKLKIQEKPLSSSQTKINITQKEKNFNSVIRSEINNINFLPQPEELIFLLLFAVPISLFSIKRWIYR
ncbi:hypothetical protein [Mastigocoleus testarum]|nr:hypothetical protein [Mastigocoleus testarum]